MQLFWNVSVSKGKAQQMRAVVIPFLGLPGYCSKSSGHTKVMLWSRQRIDSPRGRFLAVLFFESMAIVATTQYKYYCDNHRVEVHGSKCLR